jgi:hypothetical protein
MPSIARFWERAVISSQLSVLSLNTMRGCDADLRSSRRASLLRRELVVVTEAVEVAAALEFGARFLVFD